MNRKPPKPYLSKNVMEGLLSLAERTTPQSVEEIVAIRWIAATRDHRLDSGSPDPQDAECLPGEPAVAEGSAIAGSGGSSDD